MTWRKKLTAGREMKLRSTVLYKTARRKESVTSKEQSKAIPIQWKSWWKESGGTPKG